MPPGITSDAYDHATISVIPNHHLRSTVSVVYAVIIEDLGEPRLDKRTHWERITPSERLA